MPCKTNSGLIYLINKNNNLLNKKFFGINLIITKLFS